jgi:hypothetical protein
VAQKAPPPSAWRRRIPTLVVLALVLGVSGLGVARFGRVNKTSGDTPPTPWVEVPQPSTLATPRVPELSPPSESPPPDEGDERAAAETTGRTPASATLRRKQSTPGRSKTTGGRARAASDGPPSRGSGEPEPKRESPPRWNGRELDRESPYGGAPAAPPARSKHTIDRNNPWPGGESE